MNKFFYPKLAITSMRKNKTMYFPYLIASALCIAIYYIMDSVRLMVIASGMKGRENVYHMLAQFNIVSGIVSLVILFYVNSFVIKRRKREFGLYAILGMEKRHISLMLCWEVLLLSLLSFAAGIACGILFSQLMFLLLLQILHIPAELTFILPVDSIGKTVVWFVIGFIILLIFDIISIWRTNAIQLLYSAKAGEREPKARWALALMGLLALGGGYYLALTAQTKADAITIFFPAVLLVAVGTYLLFISGSIVFLKLLKKNQRFYYKPSNFITVSGMLYRMKQNAVGLASICLLSTAVLVTLSSCLSLFCGGEDSIRLQFPREAMISCYLEEEEKQEQDADRFVTALEKQSEQYDVPMLNAVGLTTVNHSFHYQNGEFSTSGGGDSKTLYVSCYAQEDYNKIASTPLSLQPGQMTILSPSRERFPEEISINGTSYRTQTITDPEITEPGTDICFIFPTVDDLWELTNRIAAEFNDYRLVTYQYFFDVPEDVPHMEQFMESLWSHWDSEEDGAALCYSRTKADEQNRFYRIYGSLFFIGIFFVTVFLTATVLIIYYKQVTEGYDDHDRFQIMQKVGLSDREVKRAIQKQILTVFFLPLVTAVIHVFAALPILSKILMSLGLLDPFVFILCTLATISVFAVFYFIVYQLTAKTYYRIVKAKE